MSYFDTHAHLTLLTHTEGSDAWARAKEASISELVTVSTDETNWESNRQFAEKYDGVYYSVGMHPHETDRWEAARPKMEAFLEKNVEKGGTPFSRKCVAIGEMGLDFHYNHATRENQIRAFEEHCDLAVEWNLPLIIHCRDAFADVFEILTRKQVPPCGAVLHCFTGGLDEAKEAAKLDLYLSFSGILTFKTAESLRAAAKVAPESRLLIETDCPYLAPIPHRGKPNEPLFLPETAKALAAARGTSLEKIAEITTTNARRFFAILP